VRSKYTEAWERPDAPSPLKKVPLQSILSGEPFRRVERARRKDWMTYSAGQIVGRVTEPTTVKAVIYDMILEYAETMERVSRLIEE
jgi:NAD(P)H-dependent flavin oxidoreductase YrpB (nitropropane dioxygenase family)